MWRSHYGKSQHAKSPVQTGNLLGPSLVRLHEERSVEPLWELLGAVACSLCCWFTQGYPNHQMFRVLPFQSLKVT